MIPIIKIFMINLEDKVSQKKLRLDYIRLERVVFPRSSSAIKKYEYQR